MAGRPGAGPVALAELVAPGGRAGRRAAGGGRGAGGSAGGILVGAVALAVLVGSLSLGGGSLRGAAQLPRESRRAPAEAARALRFPGPAPGFESNRRANLVPLGNLVIELALDASSVYALVDVGDTAIPVVLVARIDRQTQRVAWSRPLPGGSDLVLAGGWLWVTGGAVPGSSRGDARGLYRMDPVTLDLQQRVDLPAPRFTSPAEPTALAAPGGGPLWLAVGRHLYRLEPSSGRIEATQVVDHPVVDLATDPFGVHLYAVEDAGRRGAIVSRYGARDGVLRVRRPGLGGPGGGRLSATAEGVWAFFPAGKDRAVLLRALDLETAATVEGRSLLGTAGIDAAGGEVGGGALWVSDLGGVYCVDPASGRLRAPAPQAGRGPVAADDSGVYAGAGGGLTIVAPDPRCRP